MDISLTLKCAEYISNVDSDSHVNIYALASVKETGQKFISQEAVWIEKPHIELKVIVEDTSISTQKHNIYLAYFDKMIA